MDNLQLNLETGIIVKNRIICQVEHFAVPRELTASEELKRYQIYQNFFFRTKHYLSEYTKAIHVRGLLLEK